jgi:hypothetical protein
MAFLRNLRITLPNHDLSVGNQGLSAEESGPSGPIDPTGERCKMVVAKVATSEGATMSAIDLAMMMHPSSGTMIHPAFIRNYRDRAEDQLEVDRSPFSEYDFTDPISLAEFDSDPLWVHPHQPLTLILS